MERTALLCAECGPEPSQQRQIQFPPCQGFPCIAVYENGYGICVGGNGPGGKPGRAHREYKRRRAVFRRNPEHAATPDHPVQSAQGTVRLSLYDHKGAIADLLSRFKIVAQTDTLCAASR